MSKNEEKNELVLKQELMDGCELSPVGAVFDENMTFDQWREVGKLMRFLEQAIQFAIGDWLNFGDAVYGEKYSQALEDTSYSYSTLQTYAWVCRKISHDCRLNGVPFTHHMLVAKCEPAQQKRFLQYALKQIGENDGDYSVSDFRKYIKSQLGVSDEGGDGAGNPAMTDEEKHRNALIFIRDILSEKKLSGIPDKNEIQWMTMAIKRTQQAVIDAIGEK